MIKGALYPEKWNRKAHLELLLFREFFLSRLDKESEISYDLSQDGSIELVKDCTMEVMLPLSLTLYINLQILWLVMS